jgi:hypothetical protein
MDAYNRIENLMVEKYGKVATTRKAVGDFMLDENHAVNVKSNNVAKANYSPNMISIKKMHEWVFQKRNELSFIFIDYEENGAELKILSETDPISIEKISWECLSIEAQGYGVIQKVGTLVVLTNQTKKEFYKGFLVAYAKYLEKEKKKHERFSKLFLNPDNIDW